MAITLVDAGLISSATNGNDITLSLTGALEDDTVLVFGGFMTTLGTPSIVTSGYTLGRLRDPGGAGNAAMGVWYKRMGASPDASVVCEGGGNAIAGVAYGRYILRGVDASVLDVAVGESTNTAGLANPPAVTTTTTDTLVIAILGNTVNAGQATAAPSGYSNFLVARGNDSWDYALASGTKAVAAIGTEDPGNFSWSGGSSQNQVAFTVVIREAGATDVPLAPTLTVGYTDTDAFMAIDGFAPHPDQSDDLHESTTWQITTAADTGFAAPVVDVETDEFLLAYNSLGTLTPSTDYIARARTNGVYSGNGDWSDTVSFTTEAAAPRPATPVLTLVNVEEDEVTFGLSDFAV